MSKNRVIVSSVVLEGRSKAEAIVALRRSLTDQGHDSGAHTIAAHLQRDHGTSPAVSTIWNILRRHDLVTPQPRKRPRSSYQRFQAELPNETWQSDFTHWKLANGSGVVTLRYNSRLHHIGIGRAHKGEPVHLLIHDDHIRIVNPDTGELLRQLTIDPTRDYQPQEPQNPLPKEREM